MTRDEESALVERLKAGDQKAQRCFFDLFFEPLFKWVRAKGIRHKEDALEIVRNTFIRAFKAIAKFRLASSLKTWVFSIAVNALKDYKKSPKHTPIQTGSDISGFDDAWTPGNGAYRKSQTDTITGAARASVVSSDNADLERLITDERRQKLSDLLDRLSPAHREVLHLRMVEGLSIEETAQIMGRTKDATKMLQLRAGEALQVLAAQDPYFNEGTPSMEVSH